MATLQRPLAVVTGASSGIGLELARELGGRGHDLVIVSEEERIGAAALELRETGATVHAVRADLATAAGCQELVRAAEALGRPIEVIALNAGVGVGGDFARETDLAAEENIVELNCLATVRLAKWAARDMAARGRGRILFTASIAALMPTPLQAVYGASKAFVLSFSASLHAELEKSGVTVTAMLPGPTDTEFFSRAGMEDTKVAADKAKDNDPAEVARQGVDALLAGKERVAAGNFSVKLQATLARFMPESLKAEQHRKMAQPGSARE